MSENAAQPIWLGQGRDEGAIISRSQVVGHVHDDSLGASPSSAVEQGGLDEERGLVVQQVLPPAVRHKLRQDDDRQLPVVVLGIGLLQELKKRSHQRTEW